MQGPLTSGLPRIHDSDDWLDHRPGTHLCATGRLDAAGPDGILLSFPDCSQIVIQPRCDIAGSDLRRHLGKHVAIEVERTEDGLACGHAEISALYVFERPARAAQAPNEGQYPMPRFVFAAARDGDMLLDHLDAADLDAATEVALDAAREYHSLECDNDQIECELDGFAIQPLDDTTT